MGRWSVAVVLALAMLASGCGGGSSEQAAGEVATSYAEAMARLDVHEACELEFTNRRGPAYRGRSEADEKRECEYGYLHDHPLHPGAPGPPELEQVRHLFGLRPATVESVDVSGGSATVVLRRPKTDERREVVLVEEDGHWLVQEVELGGLIGP